MRYNVANWTRDEFITDLTEEEVTDYIIACNGDHIDVAPHYERVAA
jgi:hypothetical protein